MRYIIRVWLPSKSDSYRNDVIEFCFLGKFMGWEQFSHYAPYSPLASLYYEKMRERMRSGEKPPFTHEIK